MPKVVVLNKNVEKGIRIRNFMTGGKRYEDVLVWKGDLVSDLPYLEDKEIKHVNAKLDDVIFDSLAKVADKNDPNKIQNRVAVDSVILDASKVYKSNILMIPKSSMLEYQASGSVDDTDVLPMIRVRLDLLMSDNTKVELTLEEGMELYSTIFNAETKPAIVIGNFTVDGFVYKNINTTNFDIIGVILKSEEGKTYTVDLNEIKNFGKQGLIVGDDVETLVEAIQKADSDPTIGGISLPGKSEVLDALTFNGTLSVNGVYSDTPANSGDRKSDTIDPSEDVFKATITCNKDSDVTINGVTLTEGSLVLTDQPKAIHFSNCKFVNMTSTGKTFLLRGNGFKDTSTLVTIENCYFGSNTSDVTNYLYNLFECNMKLADGSSFSNNYFAKECCTHNMINIYDVEDGATITIEGNTFEYSANAIRFGATGSPKCTVNITNNTFLETDSTPEYAGLMFVQPYGTQTVTMEDTVINIDNTTCPPNYDGQLFYVYCGENDTQLTEETYPKIYVNGILQEL